MNDSLVIDVGGTYSRLAIMDRDYHIDCKETYINYTHSSFLEIVHKYIDSHRDRLRDCQHCCIAVAGPVKNGQTKLTNINWNLDAESLRQALPFRELKLLNDFHALGYCVPLLHDSNLLTLQTGLVTPHHVKLMIGAGTGLGVAHIKQKNSHVEVYPSEGGHVDFAPINKRQMDLLQFMMTKYEHVSVEHLLSGHGIEHLFEFVCMEHNIRNAGLDFDVQDYMAEDITGQKVIQLAMDKQHPIAIETVEFFCEIYAAYVGNIALTTLPYGGIYITGGIARHILPFLQKPEFLQTLKNKGRMSSLLDEIPIYYILNQNANLLGAGYYLQMTGEAIASVRT